MQYAQNPFADPRHFIRKNKGLIWIIGVNIIIWGLISVGRVLAFLFAIPDQDFIGSLSAWLALPASTASLLSKPWTLLTYMFLHIDFLHILFNLLWLFWFGKIFLEFLSQKRLVWAYFLSGITGGLLYIIFYNVFPVFARNMDISFALGASAAVMGIVTAISFYVPRYTIQLMFIGKVRIIYIAIILFVLDFFMIRSDNSGGHIAHIGGALYGMAFAGYLRQYFRWGSLAERFRFSSSRRSHDHSGKKQMSGNHSGRPLNDEQFNLQKIERQRKIDEILDKISKSGYESLSREEKEFLFRSSGQR